MSDQLPETLGLRMRRWLATIGILTLMCATGIVGGYMQLAQNFDWYEGRPICDVGKPDVSLGAAIIVNFGYFTCPHGN